MALNFDALAKDLSVEQFRELSDIYSAEQLHLLTRNGVSPYNCMDCVDKLSEISLPSKSAFHSKLNDTDISDEDYAHAIKVSITFGCKTFFNYTI